MGKKVVYRGASARDDSSTVIVVDGVRLEQGTAVEVKDDELARELLSGDSDRLKGHKFEEADDEDDGEVDKANPAEPAPRDDEGGAGDAGPDPRGTTRSRSR